MENAIHKTYNQVDLWVKRQMGTIIVSVDVVASDGKAIISFSCGGT